MTVASAAASAAAMLVSLADHIATTFPHHSSAIKGEVVGTRLTNDRWNRISAILRSLMTIPHDLLSFDEREARIKAISAVDATLRMAKITFGTKEPTEYDLSFVEWWSSIISDKIIESEKVKHV